MPKEITHILFSDETFDKLKLDKNRLSEIISSNLDFYHFGCVGVDSFYYNIKLPFIDKEFVQWGDFVHGADGNDTALAFRNCADYLKKNLNEPSFDKKLAFIAGFITHIAMDINFHPYVYYFSGNYYDGEYPKRVDAMMRHRLIEAWIDLFMLNRKNIDLHEFDSMIRIENNKKDNYEIIEFICKFFAEAWETDKEMIPSFKRGYKIQMFLNNHLMKNRSFFSFFRIVNYVFDNRLRDLSALFYPTKFHEMPDYIVNFGSFIHPVTGEKFEGNLLDLWNNGLNLSHKFLKSVNDYIFEGLSREEFDDIFRGYSLDVGLVGVNVKEVKHFSPWSIVP